MSLPSALYNICSGLEARPVRVCRLEARTEAPALVSYFGRPILVLPI